MELAVAQQEAGPIRREKLFGRQHFVVPATLVREMVLSNNIGRMFLPAEEIERSVNRWNFTPVTLGHPTRGGQPTTARDPNVVNSRAVGILFNARFDEADRALKADVFIDPEQASNVRGGEALLAQLDQGEVGEVSTGFTFQGERKEGEFEDEPFDIVAHELQPDHFAVGIKEGACSVEDGCGLGVNCNCEDHMDTESAENVADTLWERIKAHLTRSEKMDTEQIQTLSDATGLSEERLAEMEEEEIEALATNVLDTEEDTDEGEDPDPAANVEEEDEGSEAVNAKIEALEEKVAELSAEREERREELVGVLAENERCTFEREELEDFSLDRLEKVAQMAKVRDYGGRGGPRVSTGGEVELGFEVQDVWADEN